MKLKASTIKPIKLNQQDKVLFPSWSSFAPDICQNLLTLDSVSFSSTCHTINSLLKTHINILALIKHIADDDIEKVQIKLNQNPSLLLTNQFRVQWIHNKITGQKLRVENPLIMAFKRHQDEMIDLLLHYFVELEKKKIIKNANAEVSRQLSQLSLEVYDIDELRSVLLLEMFNDGYENDSLIDRISNHTKEKLENFRNAMLSGEHCYNVEQTLYSAYQSNEHFDYFISYEQEKLFSIAVIGFLQSLLPSKSVGLYYRNSGKKSEIGEFFYDQLPKNKQVESDFNDSLQTCDSQSFQKMYSERSVKRTHFVESAKAYKLKQYLDHNVVSKLPLKARMHNQYSFFKLSHKTKVGVGKKLSQCSPDIRMS